MNNRSYKTKRSAGGFTLVELVVTASIGVALFSAVALVYRSIVANQSRLARFAAIEIGLANASNFYELTTTSVDSFFAPNYGRCMLADQLRDRFLTDVEHATAVFCLPRAGNNNFRPLDNVIDMADDVKGMNIDTPAEFLAHLEAAETSTVGTFSTFRGVPPTSAKNTTIFVLQPSGASDELWIRAIYEIDFVDITVTPTAPSDPHNGTYASVRRYVSGKLTHYYDIFYQRDPGRTQNFGPAFVNFERAARVAKNEGTAIDQFKKANEQPFYFIWWPDPAHPVLEPGSGPASYSAGDPRSASSEHAGQTRYLFTVPMFPAL